MKKFLFAFFFCSYLIMQSQNMALPVQLQNTMIAKLKGHDSLVYYQCHVEEVIQQLSTASGQTLTANPEKYSITEKFILTKKDSSYKVRYYISSMIILPNRRFSGLKIREKPYWNFKKVKEEDLSEKDVKLLAALELKGKEPTEYDFAISKYNTNQVIVKRKKDFRQVNIDGNYIISKLILD